MYRKLPYLFLFISTLFLFSCKKQSTSALNSEIGPITNHTVTFEQAKKIAVLHSISPAVTNAKSGTRYTFKEEADQMQKYKDAEKKVGACMSFNYTQNAPSFYIINFEGGGFTIVAGDDRVHPILAYSATDAFPLDSTKRFPAGLVEWLAGTDELVSNVRRENKPQPKKLKATWEKMNNQSKVLSGARLQFPPCYYEGETYTIIETWGPYLATTWSQGVGFNDNLSYMGCSSYSNGKPPTGCVATAMAQVMAYHQRPTYFSWASMPNGWGSSATAALMADIGSKVSMDYGCDGSGAETEDAAGAFTGGYGYASASWGNYESSTTYYELYNGRPVILSGGRKDKWLFFNVYADGHAWVCDGANYIESYICDTWEDDGDPYTDEYQWLYNYQFMSLHMNWGWGGSYNGYYNYDNFNPGTNTFNYKRGMVYNIHP
ncbi:hypothetical protein GFS24_09075 [Chitinophaga sp. SYP-B3965]|uniref:C10 family peptidase n=1 Tax=Chitinophaga sp. SYP-B3965 TaxID=2663120 RepID=UPI0012996D15|nr:C10 family peptidase [Chitinophaga sp. SYP-B3965]MRG45266.1 hypothetical protein [Chitinophaga sp. SYP-B3965]